MITTAALQRRITSLEASRHPIPRRSVRTHIIDCAPVERPARIAAIEAAEPGVCHIVRVVVDPRERKAMQ